MSTTTVTTDNPLREGLRLERVPHPCAMVIFGATGDLTRRKLVPALYNLAIEGLLPPGFSVVGYARRPWSDDEFRQHLREGVDQFSRRRPVEPGVWDPFAQGISYIQGEFEDTSDFKRLAGALDQLDRDRGTAGNRIYYLATPPTEYEIIADNLGRVDLNRTNSADAWARIIVEKPFGRDLDSAVELNDHLRGIFHEDQIYRIDHYLGKETVQNMMAFRFANGIFEPIWNRNYIDNVQITVAESIGLEGRGGYYDQAGALRDIVQNHIMQLMSVTAMEPPIAFEANAVRDEKVKVLRAIPPVKPDDVSHTTIRGQYGPGWIAGQEVAGYRQEKNVAPNSVTETYVALKLSVENWRWAGVPFYLRSGKRMPRRVTEIAIEFKNVPHPLFKGMAATMEPNVLSFRIQPDEGISLKIAAKVPGPQIRLRSVNMGFLYGTSFMIEPPDAYERLLLDCMLGDSTLFTRRDETEAAWKPITSILEGWAEAPAPTFPNYDAGTWGPHAADIFMARDGREWRQP
ncbi:MAG TPA: glucose-6-phosphate dehydrogenase [Thermomicrobiaceae bacterium]|nr:glucose-6-phosphate dehydrogenase [Thermomicrobiaceae bacterium]